MKSAFLDRRFREERAILKIQTKTRMSLLSHFRAREFSIYRKIRPIQIVRHRPRSNTLITIQNRSRLDLLLINIK